MTDQPPAWPLPPCDLPIQRGELDLGGVGGEDRRKGVEICEPGQGKGL